MPKWAKSQQIPMNCIAFARTLRVITGFPITSMLEVEVVQLTMSSSDRIPNKFCLVAAAREVLPPRSPEITQKNQPPKGDVRTTSLSTIVWSLWQEFRSLGTQWGGKNALPKCIFRDGLLDCSNALAKVSGSVPSAAK